MLVDGIVDAILLEKFQHIKLRSTEKMPMSAVDFTLLD
jgi:hypothetical protein